MTPFRWFNLLAVDAAVIAPLWFWVFGLDRGYFPDLAAAVVLALSVWLTYTADRWLDAVRRPPGALVSLRHRFAKRHARGLALVWTAVLLLCCLLAFAILSGGQLARGGILLAACLAYTLANQYWSRRFFPKEICVALIYAGGAVVFLPPPLPWWDSGVFAWLCFLNCLIVSRREQAVDRALASRSLASVCHRSTLALLWLGYFPACLWGHAAAARIGLTTGGACLLVLWLLRHRFPVETYRVLADLALGAGAIAALAAGMLN